VSDKSGCLLMASSILARQTLASAKALNK